MAFSNTPGNIATICWESLVRFLTLGSYFTLRLSMLCGIVTVSNVAIIAAITATCCSTCRLFASLFIFSLYVYELIIISYQVHWLILDLLRSVCHFLFELFHHEYGRDCFTRNNILVYL